MALDEPHDDDDHESHHGLQFLVGEDVRKHTVDGRGILVDYNPYWDTLTVRLTGARVGSC